MTQKKFWLASIIALGIVLTTGWQPLFAQGRVYHIASGQETSGTTIGYDVYYDSLEELREATALPYYDINTNSYFYYHLFNGDSVVLYDDDNSLTDELGIADNATVRVYSDDPAQQRRISIEDPNVSRFFNMNRTTDLGSTLYAQNVIMDGGKEINETGGGAIHAWWHNNLYLNNVTFTNNYADGWNYVFEEPAGGGAIFYWDALNCEIVDTNFIDNSTKYNGGAIYINASMSMAADETNITLRVTENATPNLIDGRPTARFSGNRDGVEVVGGTIVPDSGTPNSIDFTGATGNTVNFNIATASGTLLDMQDPFRTNRPSINNPYWDEDEGYTVNINKTGAGTWGLGGTSVIDGSSGTTIWIQEGTLELYEKAQLNAVGSRDTVRISRDAEVMVRGGNTITGTNVLFDPGAILSFDMDFYDVSDPTTLTTPMLYLSSNNPQIAGTRINVTGMNLDNPDYFGNYTLVRGSTALEAGNFDLWVNSSNVDVSGNSSDRFGYSLSNAANPNELVFKLSGVQNTVLVWNNGANTDLWSLSTVEGKNWVLPYFDGDDRTTDAFVHGDTVVFDGLGNTNIRLTQNMRIGANDTTLGPDYTDHTIGTHSYRVGMHVTGTRNWGFQGSSILSDNDDAVVLFDGSGLLSLHNTAANGFIDTTNLVFPNLSFVHAGTGTVDVTRADQLGPGTFLFENNNVADTAGTLHFSGRNATTVSQGIETTTGADARITADAGKQVTFTADPLGNGNAITVGSGSKLVLIGNTAADSAKQFVVEGNYHGVSVNGSTAAAFEAENVLFQNNIATDGNGSAIYAFGDTNVTVRQSVFQDNHSLHGGAIYSAGGNLTVEDSKFLNNTQSDVAGGGAIEMAGGILSINATEERTTLFEGNTSQVGLATPVRNSVHLNAGGGGVTMNVNTAADGVVDMRDPFSTDGGGGTISVNKTGAGTWKLSGENEINNSGANTFIVAGGILHLYGDADKNVDDQLIAPTGNITMATGTFTVQNGASLTVGGGNSVTAENIELENGATLGFNLGAYDKTASETMLHLNAATGLTVDWGQVNVNITALDWENRGGNYNLLELDGNGLLDDTMNLQYRGTDMDKLRDPVGTLAVITGGPNDVLQLNISSNITNGRTGWTNGDGDFVWDRVAQNWLGRTTDILNTLQFMDGDEVLFGNDVYTLTGPGGTHELAEKRSGTVTIVSEGVTVRAFDGSGYGMTVNNSSQEILTPAGTQTVRNDYVFIGGSIDSPTGNNGLLKEGDGDVTFTQSNPDWHGATDIRGGTVTLKKVDSLGTGGVNTGVGDLRGGLVFDIGNLDSGTYGETISGTGWVRKTGEGALTLSGVNSYSDGTEIQAGQVILTNADATGTWLVSIGDRGALVFNLTGTAQEEYTNRITGNGAVHAKGHSDVILANGGNDYRGGTLIDANATITARQLGALGTGNVDSRGHLVFDLNDEGGALRQVINGSGDVTKRGSQILDLTEKQTYTGATNLEAGGIRLVEGDALENSTLNITGGQLLFDENRTATLGSLIGSGNIVLENEAQGAVNLTVGASSPKDMNHKLPGHDCADHTYWGSLSGAGSLTKIGGGDLTLAGTNTQVGPTVIKAGKLVAKGAQAVGPGGVVNDGELEFVTTPTMGEDSKTYGAAISGTGKVIKSGDGSLTLTAENTYEGGTDVVAGTLAGTSMRAFGTGAIDLAREATLDLGLAADESFGRNLTGFGTFLKSGDGTLTIDKDMSFSGTTQIQSGMVFVNAKTNSETTVFGGATLAGKGYINNHVLFQDGSIQRIGHRTDGVLSEFRAGSVAYEGGTTIYVKVGKNASDTVIADRGFDFAQGGGTMDVVFINVWTDDSSNDKPIPRDFEVFLAGDGTLKLDGTTIYDTVSESNVLTLEGVDGEIRFRTDESEGLGLHGYSVTTDGISRSVNMNISVRNPATLAYLSTNQRAVMAAIGDPEIYDIIYGFSRDRRGEIINELMPMITTAMPLVTQRSVVLTNQATFERLRYLRDPMAISNEESPRLSHIHARQNYLWFQNFGDLVSQRAIGDRPEFRIDSYGFMVGYDRGVGHHGVFGLGLGGYFSDIKANESYQSAEANSFLLSAYGNWVGNENWSLAGATGFVFSTYDTERVAPNFGTKLTGRHRGTTFYASLEGEKKFLFGRTEVTPYLGVDAIWMGQKGYTEKAEGMSSLALRVKKDDTFSLLSTAGVRLGWNFRMLGGNLLSPSVYAAWVHDWADGHVTSKSAFAGQSYFRTRGASMLRDRAQVGLNMNMTLNDRLDFFGRFNTELAKRYSDMSFHFGFRLGF